MRALLVVLAFISQGVLTPLLTPWPPPDLLLVMALLPLGHAPLWRSMLFAYLLGGVQDLAGGGVLGLHAFTMAAAVFAAGLVAGPPDRVGLGSKLLVIAVAFVGKAAVWTLLLTFLGQADPLRETLRVVPPQALLTLAVVAFLHPLSARLARRSERRLYL